MLNILQHHGGHLVRGKPRNNYLFIWQTTDKGFGAADCVTAEPTCAGRIGSVLTDGVTIFSEGGIGE